MLEASQVLGANTQLDVPAFACIDPVLEPLFVSARLDEILDLHLLEFERTEDEIARRNFVAK